MHFLASELYIDQTSFTFCRAMCYKFLNTVDCKCCGFCAPVDDGEVNVVYIANFIIKSRDFLTSCGRDSPLHILPSYLTSACRSEKLTAFLLTNETYPVYSTCE